MQLDEPDVKAGTSECRCCPCWWWGLGTQVSGHDTCWAGDGDVRWEGGIMAGHLTNAAGATEGRAGISPGRHKQGRRCSS